MGEVRTYNRLQRRELLKTLQRRRRILMHSPLLENKSYKQLSQEEFLELRDGKCPDKERQEGFNKIRRIMDELFRIDTKINEITIDLANKTKR